MMKGPRLCHTACPREVLHLTRMHALHGAARQMPCMPVLLPSLLQSPKACQLPPWPLHHTCKLSVFVGLGISRRPTATVCAWH